MKSNYRIWQTCWEDAELQIMHSVKAIDFEKEVYWVTTSVAGYHFKDAILMRTIGLKDISNESVFEGDLVVDLKNDIFEVKFNEDFCAFFLYPIKKKKDFMAIYPSIQVKIIGNIYKNPNLLKHKK